MWQYLRSTQRTYIQLLNIKAQWILIGQYFFLLWSQSFFVCTGDLTVPQNSFRVFPTALLPSYGRGEQGKGEAGWMDPDVTLSSRFKLSGLQTRTQLPLWGLEGKVLCDPGALLSCQRVALCRPSRRQALRLYSSGLHQGRSGPFFLKQLLRNVLHCHLSVNTTFVLKRNSWLPGEKESLTV